MTAYWSWWATAAALGALMVGFWVLERRPLGVSGVLARFADLRAERARERVAAELATDAAALEAALLAATAEAAVSGELAAVPDAGGVAPRAGEEGPGDAPPSGRSLAPLAPLSAHAVFLGALAVGGLLARLARGGFRLDSSAPAWILARTGGEAGALAAIALGGVLVGFGTAWSGGCTAGHGLTGCARLLPASLLATAAFVAAGMAVSRLLGCAP